MVKSGLTVLQVIPELDAGGAERTTLEIAEAIIAAGGHALVASEGGRMEADLAQLGGELIRLPLKSKSPLTLWNNRNALKRVIRNRSVDLVHARSRAPAWSALWAARATHTPFVTTYHGAYSGKSALKVFYNSVMARGDLVIANSDYIADHIRATHKLPADKIVTIPRGVDLRIFSPDKVDPSRVSSIRSELINNRKYLFLLPGRLTEWKGQGVFIDALSRLTAAEKSEITAVMVGDAQGRTAYLEGREAQINALHLDELVKISGHYSDMPSLYAAADLILAPSTRPEAFGRVAIEANAMGKPVIASNHGGQQETIKHGETGWLTEPGDAAGLAEAMHAFLTQPERDRQNMSQTAVTHVRSRYTTEALQKATLEVYDRAMASSTGGSA